MTSTTATSVVDKPIKKRKPVRKTLSEGNRPHRGWQIAVTGAMVIASFYFLAPVVWLIIASTKSAGDLFSTGGFAFADFEFITNLKNLSNYDGGIFWRWVLNSVIYSIIGAAMTTFVCAVAGYGLAVFRFKGRGTVIGIVLGSMLIPGTVIAQPTYVLLVRLGLDNTYWGILLPALAYPFGVLLCWIYAQGSVPLELVEAARLDGAGEFRVFFSMGLRLMSNGLVTVMLFAFLGSWNSYLLPLLVLTDQKLMPLTVGLTGWSQASITIPSLQTLTIIGSLVSVVPIAIAFVSLQRFWKSGLTTGGLRG